MRIEYILNAVHDGVWEYDFRAGVFQFSGRIFTMLGYAPMKGKCIGYGKQGKCYRYLGTQTDITGQRRVKGISRESADRCPNTSGKQGDL